MKVAERFISINGEGQWAGELAVFLRFCGCNLSCVYCDTVWANEPDCPYKDISSRENYDFIKQSGIKNVTLTGGEPLLAEGIQELLALLLEDEGLRVEVETNGAVSLESFCKGKRPSFTMDYKLPGSGMEDAMITDNFRFLTKQDTVKFVVTDAIDLVRAREVMDQYGLSERTTVYFSPVFGSIAPEDIVHFMKRNRMNDVRLQLQLHKAIWHPQTRGV